MSSLTPKLGGCPAQCLYLLALLPPRRSTLGSGSGPQLTRCPPAQEELESYPLSAVVRCDTVTPPGQSCSLLLLVCQEPESTQPDVHFFQGLRLGVSGPGTASAPHPAGTLRLPGAGGSREPARGGWGRGLGKGGGWAGEGAWPGKKFGNRGAFEDRLNVGSRRSARAEWRRRLRSRTESGQNVEETV